MMRFPQVYNNRSSLTTTTFWKNAVITAIVDGAICFFLTFYAVAARGKWNANDLYSVGHTAYTAMLGTVTLEVRIGFHRAMFKWQHMPRQNAVDPATHFPEEQC